MNAESQALAETSIRADELDLEAIFREQYPRIARLIAGVVHDTSRAEELAVDVFLKLWRTPASRRSNAEGWLYRAAVRTGIDELRRKARQRRYERWLTGSTTSPAPDQLHLESERQLSVRTTLASLRKRQAELLILRSNGLSYQQIAAALNLRPTSVGALLGRAQTAFKKEYVKRYGEQ